MIIFSPHALSKLEQRGLNKDKVIETLRKPDLMKPSYGNRILAYKNFGKLYLKVVFRNERKDTVIITAHWTDKIK